VICAPSGDEGSTGYIEIKKTENKLSETKGNNKRTNEQKNDENTKKKKEKNHLKAELDRCCEIFRHCAQWRNHV
jgi:CRISPR/Cas system CSM-associated protein Csm3 (group 7 of RAMP superfamily)